MDITKNGYYQPGKKESWNKEYTDYVLNKHREAPVADHPDGSVTDEKIGERKITYSVPTLSTGPLGDAYIAEDRIAATLTLSGHLAAVGNKAADAKRAVLSHTLQTPLDHPDSSVTTAKLANGAVTSAKLADDVNAQLASLEAADSGLENAITAEQTTRENEDAELQAGLDAEISARAGADAELQGQIGSVADRLLDVEHDLYGVLKQLFSVRLDVTGESINRLPLRYFGAENAENVTSADVDFSDYITTEGDIDDILGLCKLNIDGGSYNNPIYINARVCSSIYNSAGDIAESSTLTLSQGAEAAQNTSTVTSINGHDYFEWRFCLCRYDPVEAEDADAPLHTEYVLRYDENVYADGAVVFTNEINSSSLRDLNSLITQNKESVLDAINELCGTKADKTSVPTKLSPRAATFVIGTSVSGHTPDDCDYLCDGTADDVEINAAIAALPDTGGKVLILEGTYNITAPIGITKNSVTLAGCGVGTILTRQFISNNNYGGVVNMSGAEYCAVCDLAVDGNAAQFPQPYSVCVHLLGTSMTTVENVFCYSSGYAGIYARMGNRGLKIINGTFFGNTCGIVSFQGKNWTIAGNRCYENTDEGIKIGSSAGGGGIASNNVCYDNGYGIYLYGAVDAVAVACNELYNNTCGIYASSANSGLTHSAVTGNTIYKASYGDGEYSIYLAGEGNSYNLIADNNIYGKDYVCREGTSNTFVNNKYS